MKTKPTQKKASNEVLSDAVLDELIKGYEKPEDVTGPGGLLAQLTKRVVERVLKEELNQHLGYPGRAKAGRGRPELSQRIHRQDIERRTRRGAHPGAAGPGWGVRAKAGAQGAAAVRRLR